MIPDPRSRLSPRPVTHYLFISDYIDILFIFFTLDQIYFRHSIQPQKLKARKILIASNYFIYEDVTESNRMNFLKNYSEIENVRTCLS